MAAKIRRRWSDTHDIAGDRCEFKLRRACSRVAEFSITTSDGRAVGVCPGHLDDALPIRVVAQKTPVKVSTRPYSVINRALEERDRT